MTVFGVVIIYLTNVRTIEILSFSDIFDNVGPFAMCIVGTTMQMINVSVWVIRLSQFPLHSPEAEAKWTNV